MEASRTISYVKTVSNKADTLQRYIKNADEKILKRVFESNTKKAIAGMDLREVALDIDTTRNFL